MGYLVSLRNISSNNKKINNFQEMKGFFIQNDFVMKSYPISNEIAFYKKEDPDFTVFFTNGTYFINTTNNNHIEKLIKLANMLDDGARIVGDGGKTYKNLYFL